MAGTCCSRKGGQALELRSRHRRTLVLCPSKGFNATPLCFLDRVKHTFELKLQWSFPVEIPEFFHRLIFAEILADRLPEFPWLGLLGQFGKPMPVRASDCTTGNQRMPRWQWVSRHDRNKMFQLFGHCKSKVDALEVDGKQAPELSLPHEWMCKPCRAPVLSAGRLLLLPAIRPSARATTDGRRRKGRVIG